MATLLNHAVRQRLEARIGRMDTASVRRWGRMTPHQAICHMSDAFRMALNEREAKPVPTSLRPVIKIVALWLPLPWPRGSLKTVPEVEQGVGGSAPGEFARDRDELIALVRRFGAAAIGERCPTHPIFGPMNATAWGRWGYRHTDHHLRQFGL